MCGMSIFNSPLFLIADAIDCDPLGVRGAAIDAHQFVDELAKNASRRQSQKIMGCLARCRFGWRLHKTQRA